MPNLSEVDTILVDAVEFCRKVENVSEQIIKYSILLPENYGSSCQIENLIWKNEFNALAYIAAYNLLAIKLAGINIHDAITLLDRVIEKNTSYLDKIENVTLQLNRVFCYIALEQNVKAINELISILNKNNLPIQLKRVVDETFIDVFQRLNAEDQAKIPVDAISKRCTESLKPSSHSKSGQKSSTKSSTQNFNKTTPVVPQLRGQGADFSTYTATHASKDESPSFTYVNLVGSKHQSSHVSKPPANKRQGLFYHHAPEEPSNLTHTNGHANRCN